ncbi:hypothetical protein DPMN_191340 [Dreissena polymorpha]|uniref:Uncharacterized protein n=1 Tax=Dreissena polymorpha TaxID=45954 RepID=A0A9D3Y0W9_DREPO|nr:hypothetical protein DPMN_191340 [Dreissena polymorpha]
MQQAKINCFKLKRSYYSTSISIYFPASFMTSICDERGQELLYAGIPITDIFKEDMGIGGIGGEDMGIGGRRSLNCLSRFGGALDAAAKQFSEAVDSGMIPMEFVNSMRKKGILIMGIGHRVKSINNPDMRVEILKDYARKNFPATPILDYAIEVEKITTSKCGIFHTLCM